MTKERDLVFQVISGPRDKALQDLITRFAMQRTSIIIYKKGKKKVNPKGFKITPCKQTKTFKDQAIKDCEEEKEMFKRINVAECTYFLAIILYQFYLISCPFLQ